MRDFIKKIQKMDGGSTSFITDKELSELKEFVEHRGYYIVTENNNVTVKKDVPEHIIKFPLTERDAVKIYQTLKPPTITYRAFARQYKR